MIERKTGVTVLLMCMLVLSVIAPLVSTQTSVMANSLPTINFIPPTPPNNGEITEDYIIINASVSCGTGCNVSNVWLNWNGTNYTMFAMAAGIYMFNVTDLTNGIYSYRVYANDTDGNLGTSETRSVTVNKTIKTFELTLTEGWNLISIPLEVANTSINAVFPNASDGDELYGYNNNSWVLATYYSDLPGWYGDLETIVPDKGYWYRANSAYTAIIRGTEAGSRSVTINTGWNLIGYTRLIEENVTGLITDVSDGDEIYGYNGGWKSTVYYYELPGWYGDLKTMEPGKGYWYRANAPFSWEY